ncbi:MAG: ABC transporter permease, partial [Bacteroidia bacterium]|nr:ABC transporter permease [Bacteroidia bacterium]
YTPQDGFQTHWARVPFGYINELPNDVPGVKHLVRFQNHERKYVRVGTDKFRPEHAYVTDKEVFEVFGLRLAEGDPATALAAPHSIVLTRSLARKYFGDQSPVGREIYVIGDLEKSETLHQVTGVMEDLPSNTHLPINMLISYKNKEERAGWAYTYILLDDKATIKQVEAAVPGFIRKYSNENVAKFDNIVFQPLTGIHLHSDLAREIVPNGKVFYVRIVGLAGLFILIIAVINFMNLNSAMALGKAKEIGMRKIMGATRRQLMTYLFTESILYNLAALSIGAGLSYAVFPVLQQFITVQFLIDPRLMVVGLTTVALLCGLAAGTYPVVLLLGLKPMQVVRTSKAIAFSRRESPLSLKRVMVTLQFCISILLLGSAFIAYNQFQYLHGKIPA